MWHNKPHILNDDDIKPIAHRIQKDVLRTDRTIRFYSGDTNIKSLFNILLTYSLTHSSISYSQGMSDLLSPILFILRDEAQAYICFCSLMKRLKTNFSVHSDTIELKIKLLQLLLKEHDPQLWEYLETSGADHILFVYRWLLLECKREFAFIESLRVFEIMWSTLKTIEIDNIDELCLFEDDTSIFVKNKVKILLNRSPDKINSIVTAIVDITNECKSLPLMTNKDQNNCQENKLKRLKSKKSLESEITECKKKFLKSRSEDDDSDGDSLSLNSEHNELKFDFETDESNDTQKTLVPETASKLLSNFAHSYSDSHINLMNNENKKDLLKKDCETNIKRLDICNLFERSTSESKLSVTEKSDNEKKHSQTNVKKSSCSSTMTTSSTSCSFCSNSLYNSYSGSYEQQSTTTESSSSSIPNKEKIVNNSSDPDSNQIKFIETFQNSNTQITNKNLRMKNIDSGYCSDVNNSRLVQTSEDLIYSLSKIDNPFLLFLCLTLFIENRDSIMNKKLDSDDIACYFDKMVRKHESKTVLNHARYLYSKLYLSKVNVSDYIQHIMQNNP